MHAVDIFLGIEVHAQHVFHHHLIGHAVDRQRGNQGEDVIGGNARAEGAGVLAQEQQAVKVEGYPGDVGNSLLCWVHNLLVSFPYQHANGLRVGYALAEEPIHQLAHAFDRNCGIDFQGILRRIEALRGGAQRTQVQALLIAKVVVNHALGHAGFLGDGL